MTILTIDGSRGEGGGQILRSALALSVTQGIPFRIENIRGKRKKPGLLRQHRACVRAAAEISGAEVHGDELRSQELVFEPGALRAGDYEFGVGSAGSTLLVLQTVLVPLCLANGESTVRISGGTHNPMAPPFDFVERAYLRLLRRMGARVEMKLLEAGFYPAGGGQLEVRIAPCPKLEPLELMDGGEIVSRRATAMVRNLDASIADRELAVVRDKLGFSADEVVSDVEDDGPGPGNALLIEIERDSVTEMFCSFGETRLPARVVAERAVKAARQYLKSEVPVGPHLADQLILPMALAGGGTFRTVAPTRHTTTNLSIIERFLPVRAAVTAEDGRRARIELR